MPRKQRPYDERQAKLEAYLATPQVEYDDLDYAAPRPRPYDEERAGLEYALETLQAEYNDLLDRSEVSMYLKTCLEILESRRNGEVGDPSDHDVLVDTGEELKALGTALGALAGRMDAVIDDLNEISGR